MTRGFSAASSGDQSAEPKELRGAGHVDLYDRVDLMPWDKLNASFGKHLGA